MNQFNKSYNEMIKSQNKKSLIKKTLIKESIGNKVYTANYYEWEDSKFLGIFSTFEKAVNALVEYYKENFGMKFDYVVEEYEVDKGENESSKKTLEDLEKEGKISLPDPYADDED